MKIAILGTRGLPPRYGGFETLADRLGRGLAIRGHQVVVYGRTGLGQPAQALIAPGLTAVRVPTMPFRGTETISAGFTSALHCGTAVRPDVALVCNPANVWAAKLLRRMGVPALLHLDGLEHQRSKWQGAGSRIHEAAMHAAAASGLPLLTDSFAIRSWYEEQLAVSPQVIAYGSEVPHPDEARLALFGLQSKRFDLIVARWEPENQLVHMIEAHAASGTEAALAVVGEPPVGEYRQRVLQSIAAHPAARSVGQVWDPSDLSAIYAGARLCLHGHTVGGTNPALLNAAASGAEVLVHDNPFNAESVDGGGWMWRDAAALQTLLEQAPWVANPRALALQQRTLERYRWDAIVGEYESLLNSLVK